jgi:hypothetical protein
MTVAGEIAFELANPWAVGPFWAVFIVPLVTLGVVACRTRER